MQRKSRRRIGESVCAVRGALLHKEMNLSQGAMTDDIDWPKRLADAVPVMYTGNTSERHTQMSRRHYQAPPPEGNVRVLPMGWRNWHPAEGRIDVCFE